jgi:hypothetical protein
MHNDGIVELVLREGASVEGSEVVRRRVRVVAPRAEYGMDGTRGKKRMQPPCLRSKHGIVWPLPDKCTALTR